MKKSFVGLCAMALTMAACQPDGFRVSGVAEGFSDGDTLYFYEVMGAPTPTDTIILKNGKFKLEGPVDSVTMASVVSADGSAGALFFKEKGSIDVTVTKSGMPKIGGTASNDAWQEVNEMQARYSVKFDSLMAPLYMGEPDESARVEAMKAYQVIEREMIDNVIKIAEKNLDNELGYFVVTSMAGGTDLGPERVKELIGKMPGEFQQRKEVVDIMKMLEGAEALAKGKVMPDFTLPTPDGQQLSALAEVGKHKVTILDFWAKWCNPCCDEMPSMVSLYQEYKDKGLGIIGISLDTDKESWTKGFADMQMTWTQVSDLQGWKSPVVELYQVNAIPFTVVVDQKGVILEKGLRGESLWTFIEESLK